LIVVVLVVLLLLPYAIAPLYRFVDPVSTVMLWRRANGGRVERTVVPIARMAPALPRAVVAAEDGNFCRHHGVDWRGLREALMEADDLSEVRGASTITQQVAKNLFLWSGRSYLRKALELPLALWIDLVLPKQRIMEIYLNIAAWGPNGQYGAEAAARHAFGKSVSEITPNEAALLAAILPSPSRRSARAPSTHVRRLARVYEARLVQFERRMGCIGTSRRPTAANAAPSLGPADPL
jgi:monofunctional biosynthetic peptidoglycan transglycosylase